jgi:hypothetical protein
LSKEQQNRSLTAKAIRYGGSHAKRRETRQRREEKQKKKRAAVEYGKAEQKGKPLPASGNTQVKSFFKETKWGERERDESRINPRGEERPKSTTRPPTPFFTGGKGRKRKVGFTLCVGETTSSAATLSMCGNQKPSHLPPPRLCTLSRYPLGVAHHAMAFCHLFYCVFTSLFLILSIAFSLSSARRQATPQ